MAGEPHRQGLVAMGIISASLIRIVTDKLYVELVEHFMEDDTRSEKSSRQAGLGRGSPEYWTQAYFYRTDRAGPDARAGSGATTPV
jgi:hypothetical protein